MASGKFGKDTANISTIGLNSSNTVVYTSSSHIGVIWLPSSVFDITSSARNTST